MTGLLLYPTVPWYNPSMTPRLSNDLQQAVQQNHGFTEAEADGAKFVVMSMDFYRDMSRSVLEPREETRTLHDWGLDVCF